ncbi:ribulose-phosphate 3-epimerase [Lactobacillus sp.]|uniref:ribulose-phosphate 3-epimerase n=1 Tax=Lactobacillus sp. TaxID=1591 RepID=UPI003EF2196D
MLIAPSILNADNLNLAKEIAAAKEAGITRFHLDIMDGHFVPNLSFGPQLVQDFKKEFPDLEAEVHLMSNNLREMLPAFVKAGADLIEFHYEADYANQIPGWLDYLHEAGVKAGIVLNPDTEIRVLAPLLPKLDQILIMTVYPGFGGQKFMEVAPARIKAAKDLAGDIPVEVDGGINAETAKLAKEAGATIFVAGSYIFSQKAIDQQVAKLKQILEE